MEYFDMHVSDREEGELSSDDIDDYDDNNDQQKNFLLLKNSRTDQDNEIVSTNSIMDKSYRAGKRYHSKKKRNRHEPVVEEHSGCRMTDVNSRRKFSRGHQRLQQPSRSKTSTNSRFSVKYPWLGTSYVRPTPRHEKTSVEKKRDSSSWSNYQNHNIIADPQDDFEDFDWKCDSTRGQTWFQNENKRITGYSRSESDCWDYGTPAVNQILSEPSEGEKERREFGRNKNLERAAETRQASTLIQTRDTRQGAQTMKNHECQHSQKHLSFQNSEGEYGYNHERDEENERDAEQVQECQRQLNKIKELISSDLKLALERLVKLGKDWKGAGKDVVSNLIQELQIQANISALGALPVPTNQNLSLRRESRESSVESHVLGEKLKDLEKKSQKLSLPHNKQNETDMGFGENDKNEEFLPPAESLGFNRFHHGGRFYQQSSNYQRFQQNMPQRHQAFSEENRTADSQHVYQNAVIYCSTMQSPVLQHTPQILLVPFLQALVQTPSNEQAPSLSEEQFEGKRRVKVLNNRIIVSKDLSDMPTQYQKSNPFHQDSKLHHHNCVNLAEIPDREAFPSFRSSSHCIQQLRPAVEKQNEYILYHSESGNFIRAKDELLESSMRLHSVSEQAVPQNLTPIVDYSSSSEESVTAEKNLQHSVNERRYPTAHREDHNLIPVVRESQTCLIPGRKDQPERSQLPYLSSSQKDGTTVLSAPRKKPLLPDPPQYRSNERLVGLDFGKSLSSRSPKLRIDLNSSPMYYASRPFTSSSENFARLCRGQKYKESLRGNFRGTSSKKFHSSKKCSTGHSGHRSSGILVQILPAAHSSSEITSFYQSSTKKAKLSSLSPKTSTTVPPAGTLTHMSMNGETQSNDSEEEVSFLRKKLLEDMEKRKSAAQNHSVAVMQPQKSLGQENANIEPFVTTVMEGKFTVNHRIQDQEPPCNKEKDEGDFKPFSAFIKDANHTSQPQPSFELCKMKIACSVRYDSHDNKQQDQYEHFLKEEFSQPETSETHQNIPGLSKELSPAGRHVRQTGADSDPFAVTNMQAESSVDCPTTGQMVSLVNDKTRSDGKPLPDLIKCFGHFMELSSTELCKDKFSQRLFKEITSLGMCTRQDGVYSKQSPTTESQGELQVECQNKSKTVNQFEEDIVDDDSSTSSNDFSHHLILTDSCKMKPTMTVRNEAPLSELHDKLECPAQQPLKYLNLIQPPLDKSEADKNCEQENENYCKSNPVCAHEILQCTSMEEDPKCCIENEEKPMKEEQPTAGTLSSSDTPSELPLVPLQKTVVVTSAENFVHPTNNHPPSSFTESDVPFIPEGNVQSDLSQCQREKQTKLVRASSLASATPSSIIKAGNIQPVKQASHLKQQCSSASVKWRRKNRNFILPVHPQVIVPLGPCSDSDDDCEDKTESQDLESSDLVEALFKETRKDA